MELKKGLISGVIGSIVLMVVCSVFMATPGVSEWYSKNFPQMKTPKAMLAMMASVLVMGIVMGLVYSLLNKAIPGKGVRKGLNYGIMVWLLAGIMWPIMMMGFAPVYIWIVELIGGLVSYSITGVVIAIVYGKLK